MPEPAEKPHFTSITVYSHSTICTQFQYSKVLRFVQQGWPSTVPELPSHSRTGKVSCLWKRVVYCGEFVRVIVPKKLQGRVLDELHCNHLGMSWMKDLARIYVCNWCSGLDRYIEELASVPPAKL